MVELAFLGEDLQVVQGVTGAGAGAHEGHVLLAGEGHGKVELDEERGMRYYKLYCNEEK